MLGHSLESELITVLIALAGIVIFGRLMGSLAVIVGQSRAVGEITGGILLGVLLSALWPSSTEYIHGSAGQTLSSMAQIGIVLMMFQVGMEFDFNLLRQRRLQRSVLWIVLLGIPIPFLSGMLCAKFYIMANPVSSPLGLMLICGVAFSITALPILGRILLERGLQHTEEGVITIASAGLNDLIGWIILGAVVIFSTGQDTSSIIFQICAVGVFLFLLFLGTRPVVGYFLKKEQQGEVLSDNVVGLMIGGILLIGALTSFLGIFAVVGGFLLGTALYRCHGLLRDWNQKVTPFVNVVLVPIFFFYTGMKVDLSSFANLEQIVFSLTWILAGCLSKGLSCALAARIAGQSNYEALRIGIMLNTRALMELVVLNIAHELGLIPPMIFSTLVMLAIFSTLITGPLLNLLARFGNKKEQRLPPSILRE